ncbi:structural maintenance of chromosomes protein-like protein 5 [Massariosphaeria phaeospora]|uniref:Structural maintenance of chromosomes protein 5 n=1 Tax=Massariosphaeria phaeospora TaxID=100035 RepID=A0A7C8I855_9PLEO|nr:structural maintenance of chromosomes protein-like protein 5 [Massariosphaeria phaeospora]
MPGIIRKPPKRVSALISDEDEQSDSPSVVSTSSKRARHARDASDQPASAPTQTNGRRRIVRTESGQENADDFVEDAHQPGSIVRVKLVNFVTYTAVEFYPGPSLNMIIGPNGTGKSTLVCAICLGLGWSPQNLGRAKDIGEFVKHGCSEAEIEIELAAAAGQSENPVIRRHIRKEKNKSAFYLNGRSTSQKEVMTLAREFSIQIDNLCQFLPQDRVADFAKLEPVALLKETQRAAAPEHMVAWHEQLKDLHSREKIMKHEQAGQEQTLKQLQVKQNATQEDVDRWNQRQGLLTKSKALESCRPVITLKLLKEEVKLDKTKIRDAKQELAQLRADIEPARQAEAEVDRYRNQIEQVTKNRRANVGRAKEPAERLVENIKAQENVSKELHDQANAERDADRRRKLDKTRIETDIARLERAAEDRPVEYDHAASEARIAEMRAESSTAEADEIGIQGSISELREALGKLKNGVQSAMNERGKLDTQNGQQMSRLGKLSKDTAKGWKWFQENRDTLALKGEIYGPPILECTVTDPRYADAVESQLRKGDFVAITCTHPDDTKLLGDKLLGKPMSLHDVTIRTSRQAPSAYRPPVTREELKRFGFDGWLLDYIRGPDPVVAMLCDNNNLHRTAFALKKLSIEQREVLENSLIQRWISDDELSVIARRREYGVFSINVRQIGRATHFTDQPVDAEERRRLDDIVTQLKRTHQEKREQHAELTADQQKLRSVQASLRAEIDNARDEQRRLQKAISEWESIPRKIDEKKDELDSIQNKLNDTSKRIRKYLADAEESSLGAASMTIEYAKAVAQLRTHQEARVEAEIRLVEATCELDSLKEENAHITRDLAEAENAIHKLETEANIKRAERDKFAVKAQRALDAVSEDERAIMREYSVLPSLEELDNEIHTVSSRLELMAEGNPGAIKQFQNRQKQMEQARAKLEECETTLAATKERIDEIREQWEPALDTLVAKISDGFSHNFQQIGCAGQVEVYKDEEDFERWSIQIQVRFRENEPLSILTSQRQSGGERAVSTIFYLMALQDLARSPFRVVDEINQGMDPRNERKVHERMVDIACRERTSQYFLITPKLLNDLKFHPKMRVHCIASGEHMPEKHDTLDFSKLADLALRVKQ